MSGTYTAGALIDTSAGTVVDQSDMLDPGAVYVWTYSIPAYTFSLFSSDDIQGWAQQIFSYVNDNITVQGVSIDTDQGIIQIQGQITPAGTLVVTDPQTAGVEPWVILAALAGVIAVIASTAALVSVIRMPAGQLGQTVNNVADKAAAAAGSLASATKWLIVGGIVIVIVVFGNDIVEALRA